MAQEIRKLLFKDHDPYANLQLLNFDSHAWENGSFINFAEIIKELKPKLIIEVGSWLGGSAGWMGGACKELGLDSEIVCIDTWLGSVEHWGEVSEFIFENGRPAIYRQFLSNMKISGLDDIVTPFPTDSHTGLMWLKKRNVQADLIYIDGSHDYRAVVSDLIDSIPLLRYGGWIVGDDYEHPPVRKAFNDVFLPEQLADKGKKVIWVK